MKILILASNPRKDLNLDDEIRILKSVIDRSRDRDQFEVVSEPGVRVGDLQRLLLRHKPQIVHFCGHGGGKEGLIFKLEGGGEQWVRADALANMFGLNPIRSHVKCVLLNACYSEEQANAIVSQIDYVVGMSHEIQDNAAIAFSKGFYLALGEGCSIDDAFEFGRNAIQLEISGSSKMRSSATEQQRKLEVADAVAKTTIPEHLKPILKRRPTLSQEAATQVTSSSQKPLSQAKREEIQLDVAKALVEENANQQQYREKVRQFLADRKLTPLETIRLEQLRESLGLSESDAKRILEEEQEPIRKAQDEYKAMLMGLIDAGHYPLNAATQEELQGVQQELGLSDEEVKAIETPILATAEEQYQARLTPKQKQHNEQKIQRDEEPRIEPKITPLGKATAQRQREPQRQPKNPRELKPDQNQFNQNQSATTANERERIAASGSWQCVKTLTDHQDKVNTVAISANGQFLVSGGADNMVKIWNLPTGELLHDLPGHVDAVNFVAIHPDHSILASCSSDKTIKIWNLTSGKLVRTLGGWFAAHSDIINAIAISPDGRILASGSRDHSIKLWELSTGKLLHTLPTPSMGVYAVAISPDGQILAGDCQGNSIQLRDFQTQIELYLLSAHTSWIWSLAVSPDSRVLASGSQDGTIKLWNLNNGTLGHTFEGHSEAVRSVAFSPDGNTLISSSYDKTLKLWNLRTKEIICTLSEHSQGVNSVAFSPDGQTLVSGSDDHTVKLWQRQR